MLHHNTFPEASFRSHIPSTVHQPSFNQSQTNSIIKTSSPNNLDIPNTCLHDLDKSINIQENAPDLTEFLGASNQGIATCSGFSEQDYPNTNNLEQGLLNPYNPMVSPQNIKMPAELKEQLDRTQCNSSVGILPSLGNRAYLIVDSDLYLWRIKTNDDIAYYDIMSETILSVAVVKPKPNLFKSHIQHLLVIATVTDIVLLGVTIDPESQTLSLTTQPLYQIGTDTVQMSSIINNPNSTEIFLSGKDGSVYELQYGLNQSWSGYISQLTGIGKVSATQKGGYVRLVNHTRSSLAKLLFPTSLGSQDPLVKILFDSERQAVYTLSEQGSISVYKVNEEANADKKLNKITSLSQNQVAQKVKQAIIQATGPSAVPTKIMEGKVVGLTIIPVKISKILCLQATTSSGLRIFFSSNRLQNAPQNFQYLSIQHIRLPPGLTPNAEPWKRPQDIVATATNKNLSLTIACGRELKSPKNTLINSTFQINSTPKSSDDILWLFHRPENSQIAATVIGREKFQNQNRITNNTTTNAVTLGRQEQHSYSRLNSNTWTSGELTDGTLAVITSSQIFLIKSYQPSDELRSLFIESRTYESAKIEAFFEKYNGTGIATAACLKLALEPARQSVGVNCQNLAATAFFRYGSSKSVQNTFSNLPGNINNQMTSQTIIDSEKYRGVIQFISSVFHNQYDKLLIKTRKDEKTKEESVDNLLEEEQLKDTIESLNGLKQFFENNAADALRSKKSKDEEKLVILGLYEFTKSFTNRKNICINH